MGQRNAPSGLYPGEAGETNLYDDDGQTYQYEHGQSSRIKLSWDDRTRTLHIAGREGSFAGMPATGSFHIRVMDPAKPPSRDITYNGHEVDLHFQVEASTN